MRKAGSALLSRPTVLLPPPPIPCVRGVHWIEPSWVNTDSQGGNQGPQPAALSFKLPLLKFACQSSNNMLGVIVAFLTWKARTMHLPGIAPPPVETTPARKVRLLAVAINGGK